ncbi:hypothetical protein [Oceaniglobus ichthyenteri]|uniref:hypothetical protein n=1 Tax=Oceaniglobus ichthyenteri TaxID=2136177 RepID=UPI000D345D74|nr:hypothetical protein [Oceaniglobus ichthyenteri]
MSALTQHRYWTRPRLFALLCVIGVLGVFIGANTHLIYVAFASKPDCVLQQNTKGAATYRAAKPSC